MGFPFPPHRFRRLPEKIGCVMLAALLPACSSFSTPEPPVADSTLVEVLIDLTLISARSDLYHDVHPDVRDSLLARHGLSRADYEAAMEYYAEHPEAYVELYTTVLNRLNEERQKE